MVMNISPDFVVKVYFKFKYTPNVCIHFSWPISRKFFHSVKECDSGAEKCSVSDFNPQSREYFRSALREVKIQHDAQRRIEKRLGRVD